MNNRVLNLRSRIEDRQKEIDESLKAHQDHVSHLLKARKQINREASIALERSQKGRVLNTVEDHLELNQKAIEIQREGGRK